MQQSPVILDLWSKKTRTGESHDCRGEISFSKRCYSKCFPSTLNLIAGVFKLLRFEELFRKASFSRRISVDGTHNRRNKATFSNFSGVLWTGLIHTQFHF